VRGRDTRSGRVARSATSARPLPPRRSGRGAGGNFLRGLLRSVQTRDREDLVLAKRVLGEKRASERLQPVAVLRQKPLSLGEALVGDPLQSVYSFRGADPTLLLAFPRDYPEAQVFVLDQNHRSTATVVGLANAIAAPLANRPDS